MSYRTELRLKFVWLATEVTTSNREGKRISDGLSWGCAKDKTALTK